MSKVLEIQELGNPILRRKADRARNILDQKIQDLIDDLIETVKGANGVGIAAPQVGESLRIFILSSRPNPRYPGAPEMEPKAVINPEIISRSTEIRKDWEGCLSIPGIRGLVPRHKSIRARYLTRDGRREEREFRDFIARVFQHETDHLNGVVFLDRLESTMDVITEKEFRNMISEHIKAVNKDS